jgi:hypothetical protein
MTDKTKPFVEQVTDQFKAIFEVAGKIPEHIPLSLSLTVISLAEQRIKPAIFLGYGREMMGQGMWALGEALFYQLKAGVYGKAMGWDA